MLTAITVMIALYAVLLAIFGFFAFAHAKDNAEFLEIFLTIAKYLGIAVFGFGALGILAATGQ